MLVGESGEEEIGDHVIEHGITEKFEPLVVDPMSVRCSHGHGTVYHSQFVWFDVARVVAGNLMNKNIKLLILDEKELYA